MQDVVWVYKPQGMTPLQALDALRKARPEYEGVKMTYAGRLDPMAEGVLPVLIGDAVHGKERYMSLGKEYEAAVVFGVATDTFDLLGMPGVSGNRKWMSDMLAREVAALQGKREYEYPAYSSKPVAGRPLFEWARQGRRSEIVVPKRMMEVYAIELCGCGEIATDALLREVDERIGRVKGDFRQEAIRDAWRRSLKAEGVGYRWQTAAIRVRCASGTYVRTLVDELGKRLATGATVMSLVRTRVGDMRMEDALRID